MATIEELERRIRSLEAVIAAKETNEALLGQPESVRAQEQGGEFLYEPHLASHPHMKGDPRLDALGQFEEPAQTTTPQVEPEAATQEETDAVLGQSASSPPQPSGQQQGVSDQFIRDMESRLPPVGAPRPSMQPPPNVVVTQGRDPFTSEQQQPPHGQHVFDEERADKPESISKETEIQAAVVAKAKQRELERKQRIALKRGEQPPLDEKTPEEKRREAIDIVQDRSRGAEDQRPQMPSTPTPTTGIPENKQPHDQGEPDTMEAMALFAEMITKTTLGIAERLIDAARTLEDVLAKLQMSEQE